MTTEKLSPQARAWRSIVACDDERGPAETIERVEGYLRSHARHGSAWVLYGRALTSIARYPEALVAMRKGVRLLPAKRRHLGCLEMGNLYRQRGSFRLAERWYRKAVEANPKTTMTLIHLGSVLAVQGRFAEAKRCHRRAIRLGIEDVDEAHLNLGLVLRAEGRFRQAVECFDRALAIDPRYTAAKQARADALRAIQVRRSQHHDTRLPRR